MLSSTGHSAPGSSVCDREATDEDDANKMTLEFADKEANVAEGRDSAAAVAEDSSKNSLCDDEAMRMGNARQLLVTG